MSLRTTAEATARYNRDEANREAARSGSRLRYEPGFQHSSSRLCRNCELYSAQHVMETGILFCPEWALRERFGR